MRTLIFVTVATTLLAGAGCSSPPPPARAKVNGTVKYKGAPVGPARITFFDKHGHVEAGDVGADGRFTLDARLGPNQIIIEPSGAVGLPKHLMKYQHREVGLSADVKPGENLVELVLKD